MVIYLHERRTLTESNSIKEPPPSEDRCLGFDFFARAKDIEERPWLVERN